MQNTLTSNKRIAKNTLLMYARMIVVMTINLFTVRIVLNSLGVEDYGLYNVVAGVVTMLTSISGVLSTATQRYYSFSLGEQAKDRLRNVFSTSCVIFLIFSAIVAIVGETIGLWFVNTQMTIPEDRMTASLWVYQFSIIAFIFTILQVPYSAAVIAHEDMGVFASLSFVECLLKLVVALMISSVAFDKLIWFGIANSSIPVISFLFYRVYGKYRYQECHFKTTSDRSLYKSLVSFSGWTFLGSLSGIGIQQVINILVNIFFGPVINAARAISFQIHSALNSFCASFLTALNPPMVKSYAENDFVHLNSLFKISNKLIFYGLLIIMLPLFLEMDTVLYIWLGEADPTTVSFSRLLLVYTLILSLNNPISFIMQAAGKVKEYYKLSEIFMLLCPFIVWFLFRSGYNASSSFVAMIMCATISHILRVFCIRHHCSFFNIKWYISGFIIPGMFVLLLSVALTLPLHMMIENTTLRLLSVTADSILLVGAASAFIGFNTEERHKALSFIRSIFNKKKDCLTM